MSIARITCGSESGYLGSIAPGARSQATVTFNDSSGYTAVAMKYCGPARTLSAVQLILAAGGGNYGTVRVRVETSSNGIPSGTLATGAVEETFAATQNAALLCTLANQVAFTAYVTYWVVISNSNGTPATNYFSFRYQSGAWNGNCAIRGLSKATATFTASSTPLYYCGVRLAFSDGSELWPSPVGSSTSQSSALAYGGGGIRHTFCVPAPLWVDTLWVSMARVGAAPSLDFSFGPVGGSALASGSIDINTQESSSTLRPFGIIIDPVWLLPGVQYRLTMTVTGGSSSLYWRWLGDAADVAYLSLPRSQSSLLTVTETSSNGTAWTVASAVFPFAISFIGIGDTAGWGSMLLDSTVRDGASGSSVQMRAGDDLRDFSYRRWMPVQVTGSKTYSVKMRRSATAADQPAMQQVRLIRASDMSVLATLSADANANGAFYQYSSGSLSLTAGDVIIISFETRLAPTQTDATQGLAWFDTESWS